MGRIRVGTASWTDRELLASGWYPQEARTPEQRLRHYATRFPLVEVDSTYYAPPSARTCALWAERTPPGFTLDVKAFSLLTGHPTRIRALPEELRPDPARGAGRTTVRPRDLDPAVVDEVWERFCAALEPLHAAGKLGAVLFQFPPWFTAGARSREQVLACQERCRPYRISVEVRSATWMAEGERERTLGFLRAAGLPYVCVDMPQGHPSSVPPVVAATADLAVVRLHGHSSRWAGGESAERFRYRYSEAELRAWVPRLEELAARADVHVLVNTCCGDTAVTAARQLADLLPPALVVRC